MMQAVVYRRYGSPDVLRVERLPRPEPGADEILVRVRATTVTAADCAGRRADPVYARLAFGLFGPKHPVLGSEAAGDVAAVGARVTGWRVGDPVVAVSGIHLGAHAEYFTLPAAGVARKPPEVTYADAAAIAESGLTALPFLRDHAGVRPGQRVLVNGAAGGVGTSAVQLAKHYGAEVTGVCGPGNVDLVRSLGADHVIDYPTEDFTRARVAYDTVFDAVGRSTYARCREALRPTGTYLTTVPSVGTMARTMLGSRVVLAFTGLRPPAAKAADLRLLMDLAVAGDLRAVVSRRYPLVDTAEAHRYVETGHKIGAAVVTVGE